MKTMNNISRILAMMAICLLLRAVSFAAEEKKSEPAQQVGCAQGKMSIQAQNTQLGKVVEEIRQKCQVDIRGLDGRAKEPLTFLARDQMPDVVLKRLLQQLDEDNYAFEYNRAGLRRISVVPRATAKNNPTPAPPSLPFPFRPPDVPAPPPEPIATVSVMDIIPGSQAESAGIRKDDVVSEYDGIKISDSQQLIQEVKNKESKQSVEITVLRNNMPMTFVVKGGFIGINIANSNPK